MSMRVSLVWLIVLTALAFTGCGEPDPEPARPKPARKQDPAPGEGSKVNVGQNVWLEILPGKRRVLVSSEVCLREGVLEQLLTRKGHKEHEAILAADVDARKIHEALILAGAKEGSPVQLFPTFRPARGTTIRISLMYTVSGERKVASARSWIRNVKSGQELDSDWVFAGSMLVENPLDRDAPKRYLANDGDVICVSNFESALLDLPVRSSKDDADRGYEAWTQRIPAVGTKVVVVLEPVLKK